MQRSHNQFLYDRYGVTEKFIADLTGGEHIVSGGVIPEEDEGRARRALIENMRGKFQDMFADILKLEREEVPVAFQFYRKAPEGQPNEEYGMATITKLEDGTYVMHSSDEKIDGVVKPDGTVKDLSEDIVRCITPQFVYMGVDVSGMRVEGRMKIKKVLNVELCREDGYMFNSTFPDGKRPVR